MSHIFEISKVKAWAVEAGKLALTYYQTQLVKQHKDDNSPVTEADRVVEKFIVNKIQKTYNTNNYDIIAEESGGDWQNQEYAWVIDPIDGTRVFINGIPLWCISIGLLRQGDVFRGLVYLPLTGDMYYTDDEGIAFWNDRPLAGLLQTEWNRDSFIAVPSVSHKHFKVDFRRLRALGAVATHHVYVASGVALAALHRSSNVWDIAAAHAVLTAVGGVAAYLDGETVSIAQTMAQQITRFKGPMLVGHPAVVEELLDKIQLI